MKKNLFRTSILLMALFFAFLAVFGTVVKAQDNSTPQIGMILAGSLGDQSFADAAFSGLKAAERQYNISYDYVEAPPGAVEEYGRIARGMAKRGKYDLIIAESSFAAEPVKEVSKDFPDQEFMVIDAVVEDRPNVASIIYKQNEGSFLVGVIAGIVTEMEMEKTNPAAKVGFVGGMEIPVIKDFYLGYEAGAKWANPDIEVVAKYVGSFDDVSGAKEAALSMIANKVDIIFHAAGQSGLGVFEASAEENTLAIGVDSPQAFLEPDHIITSMVKRVEASVIDTARALSEGVFEPGSIYVYGVETGVGPSGIAGMGESTSAVTLPEPEKVLEKVDEAREKILAGEIEVPGSLPWTDYEQEGLRYPWYRG
ncbi:MAG: BMP family ABC transporter substrate-binding protein [Candidatus Bipolaricaulota bacterium]|nr:BMP family ABC transporter substrate-binding protein [Candidatus Bipolaricaulota bacterium]